MSKGNSTFEVKPFPLSRRMVIDSSRAGKRKNTITALIEADVTRARKIIQDHKKAKGESLSFTAFIVACLGQVVDRNKYFHARRDIWGRQILFDEVDCTTLIEIDFQAQKFPLAHVIRGVNKRSFRSIHDEIRAIQADPQASESFQRPFRLMGVFLSLPWFIRDLFYSFVYRSPRLFKEQVGTIMLSAVGMFGEGSGWGMNPGSIYTTNILLGGISEKPVVVDGRIAVREILDITVGMDHDIIDGAPAARFISRFKGLIEDAYGLDEYA